MHWFTLAFLLPLVSGTAHAGAWIVDAKTAAQLVHRGAQLIDARSADLKAKSKKQIANAIAASFDTLAPKSGPYRGRLRSVPWLKKKLSALGVGRGQIVVAGDAKRGWGEAGWIVWLLRSLGHSKVAMVDGGINALLRAGVRRVRRSAAPGNFLPRLDRRYLARAMEVKRRLRDGVTSLIDTRQAREYRGATPFGERRGGHLPGAKHLHFRRFIDNDGILLKRSKLNATLSKMGLKKRSPIIAYCTGGVRSAWLVVALKHLGFSSAKNYAGSTWEWSAGKAAAFPLVAEPGSGR